MKTRDCFTSFTIQQLSADGRHEMPYKRLRDMAREHWSELEEPQKAMWYVRVKQFPDFMIPDKTSDQNEKFPAGIDPDLIGHSHKFRAMLLTWHGSWGQDQDLMIAASNRHEDTAEIYVDIKKMSYWSELADRFFAFVVKAAEAQGFSHVSIAVEYCMKSKDKDRVHLHAMISGGRHWLTPATWSRYTFDGFPVCHCSLTAGITANTEGKGKKRKVQCEVFGSAAALRRAREAHFYLQYKKTGMLAQKTNYSKNEDCPVQRRWIMNALKIRKISLEDGIDEALDARDVARNLIGELEWIMHGNHHKKTLLDNKISLIP